MAVGRAGRRAFAGPRRARAGRVRERDLGREALGCCAPWAERWEKEKKMGRGVGLTGERNKEERAGLVFVVGLETGFGFPSFLFLSSFSNKLKLFEFKFEFEFKPSTQTIKNMHQHECTNMLNLK